MSKCPALVAALAAVVTAIGLTGFAPDRETKVRQDRAELAEDDVWVYNDLPRALAEAKKTGKPLLVVVRCIPCEACSEFDKQLLADDNEVHDLLDQFVCVRVVQGNGLDLALFQFDYDQSFHALLMNADKVVYGRFGTRSSRKEHEDMTMQGLRQAMLGALELHRQYPANKKALAGKQGRPVEFRVPEEFPALKGKYGSKLDYQGNVVRSCIHCHQIRDAERRLYRDNGREIPEVVLFPFPLPDAVGLRMDPTKRATVREVEPGSAADRAGLKPGDAILALDGQPLLSTADLQWVLHHAGEPAKLAAEVSRNGTRQQLTLELAAGWRKRSDISWRVSTWELRRMATGGLVLEDLSQEERTRRGLSADALALRVKHVGQYGDHAAAKRAGFQQDDVLIAVDGRKGRLSEGQFIAQALSRPHGEKLPVTVLRGNRRLSLAIPLQ